MDGLELLARLRQRGVTAPAVLITTPNARVIEKASVAGVDIVEKPLVAAALLEAVQALLAGTSQTLA